MTPVEMRRAAVLLDRQADRARDPEAVRELARRARARASDREAGEREPDKALVELAATPPETRDDGYDVSDLDERRRAPAAGLRRDPRAVREEARR